VDPARKPASAKMLKAITLLVSATIAKIINYQDTVLTFGKGGTGMKN
jgi:hypothetical protein